jgi:hypothetical protein
MSSFCPQLYTVALVPVALDSFLSCVQICVHEPNGSVQNNVHIHEICLQNDVQHCVHMNKMEQKTNKKMEKIITETLHSLGLKTTKESLNKTIFLLNFGSLKSHQAVFDEAFNEIAEAKQRRSWQVITECLNENTNTKMTVMTVRTMFKRAKEKRQADK